MFAGDIVAGVGLKNTTTGDTLCDPAHPIVLERMEFPEPVIHVAIEPKTKADQDKLGKALSRSSEEDPTFQVRTDDETGQTDHRRHGRAAPRGARRPHAARVQRSTPTSASRRSPTARRSPSRSRRSRTRYITPDRRLAASTATSSIDLEPTGPGGGYEFVDKITGGVIPQEYIPAGRRRHPGGARRRRARRLPDRRRAGHRSPTARTTTSTPREMAFKIAGSMAFKEAARQAKPVLLEPIMAVEVVTPEDYMGDVIGDLSAARGQVEGMEQRGNAQVDQCPGAARRRCSATLPTSVRAPRVARRTRCSSTRYQQVPGVDRRRDHRRESAASEPAPPHHASTRRRRSEQ